MKSTRNILASAGKDGSIFLSKVKISTSGDNRHDHILFELCPNVRSVLLLTSEEYNSKHETIDELKRRVQRLKSDFEFQLHSKQSLCESKLRDLSSENERLIDIERYNFTNHIIRKKLLLPFPFTLLVTCKHSSPTILSFTDAIVLENGTRS